MLEAYDGRRKAFHFAMTRTRIRPAQPSPRPPLWLVAVGGCFLLYFAVLITADILRPGPTGLFAWFGNDGAHVVGVAAGSAAERAGLQVGDRILTVAGRAIHTRLDWVAAHANLLADDPVPLGMERGGARLIATFVPARQRFGLTTVQADTVALLTSRAVQFACLVLAVLVGLKRPGDSLARLTAWLLASLGVFTIVMPYGFAHYWRQVPLPLHPLLWFPYLSGFVAPAMFFAFCSLFPGPLFRTRRLLLACCAPALLMTAWRIRFAYVVIYREARIATGVDWSRELAVLSFAYILAGLVVLALQYRRLEQAADRRRLRVLLAGTSVGFAAGGLVAALVWGSRNPQFTSSLYGSPVMLVAVPLLVALPASIAYTTLRHRLFGVGFIVRLGVRHAMARWLLLSLVPVALVAVVFDFYLHQDQAIGALVKARAWRYALAGGALAMLIANRRRWLEALDRRFFREHYHAEQILQNVAGHLRQASDPEAALAAVVQQVDDALHPTFLGVLGGRRGGQVLDVLAATPSFPDGLRLGRESRLIALSRAVGRPMDLSPNEDTWITRHLPPAEADLVYDMHVELLVPVTSGPAGDVVIVLGARRDEEPYSARDIGLLGAIAANLALLLERAGPVAEEEPGLAECPRCGACFDTSHARCPRDGALLLVTGIPPVLGGRYALRSRLGSGGMGTVYSAHDNSLGRTVAIKVLGEHLVGSTDAARRFQHEAQVAASFTHPHVVTIHDFGVTVNHRAFLVMEQLEGLTLREEITRAGSVPAERTLSIVNDLCDVLTVAHGRGLVHRDLKPENVFLTGGSEAGTKVLDFGIAKAITSSASQTSTNTGLLIGTLPYMSPEQLRGEPVDPSWDLWALAVMSQEMLTGRRPVALALTPAPEPTHGTAATSPVRAPALSPELRSFFARALALDRHQRPGNAAAFRNELAAALGADRQKLGSMKGVGIWTVWPFQ